MVWAVEDTAVQLCWGDLDAGTVTATVSGAPDAAIEHTGGPGSLIVDGLTPDRVAEITVNWRGGSARLETLTLPSPPGEELYRFATISDVHLGATRWGALKTMTEEKIGLDFERGHPFAAATSAIADAEAWGASRLVIKGDLAHHRVPEHFELAGALVDSFTDLPMSLIPGNHDVDQRSDMAVPATIGVRELPFIRTLERLDLPGLQLIAVDTTVEGRGDGRIAHVQDEVAQLVRQSDLPTFVATHQQPQDKPYITYWPPGIKAPESSNFMAALRDQPVLLTSGHTHRNRVHRRQGFVQTEVASTRDWPGVWAGYVVHEGGIRQVVRRISAPDVMRWHEYSRNAVATLWGRWSPGALDDRCITHPWPS